MVATVALYAVVVLLSVRQDLVQDTWLSLVGGRDIVAHGLPHRDSLFAWTLGRTWVDQQWLAQLLLYGLYVAGGIRLLLVAHVAMLVATASILVVTARTRGASSGAVALTGIACLLLAPWGLQARAQTIGELLFAIWLWIILGRGPLTTARLAALMLVLVVWANVHGSVILAVVLTVVRGMSLLIRDSRTSRRAAFVLVAVPPLCLFASPYGAALVGYYHRMLLNPELPRFVNEWRAPAPSRATAGFYAVLLGAAWLSGRARRRLSMPDAILLGILAVGALQAIRSIVWFAMAAVPLLAPLLDDLIPSGILPGRRWGSRLGLAGGAAAAALGLAVFAHSSSWFLSQWPAPAAARAATFAAAHPGGEVVADSRYADWLLWAEPSLRGRIAYDIRFELLTPAEFRILAGAGASTPHRPELFVFDPRTEKCGSPGRCRILYRRTVIALGAT